MNPPPDPRQQAMRRLWWILWAAMLAGLPVVWWVARTLKLPAQPPPRNQLVEVVGLVPLFVSIVIRWLVLPRYDDLVRALPMFVAGLALAEACGMLGIFLGGPWRDDLCLIGLLGLLQYLPLFARRLGEPRPTGFIPNN